MAELTQIIYKLLPTLQYWLMFLHNSPLLVIGTLGIADSSKQSGF